MAFSKLKNGQRFTYKGVSFTKTCAVSGESATCIQIFDGAEWVTL